MKSLTPPTVADVVTMTGYGLGLWWALGGPTWAGLTSILADEVDGRIARAMGQASDRGSALDWGADVTLASISMIRLGEATGYPNAGIAAAPIVLFGQAAARADDIRPQFGSVRAAVMLTTMLVEQFARPR